MEQALVQRLREVLGDLPPEDVYAIIAFAQFLSERRQVAREAASNDELAEVEHTRILRVLDAVVALSSEAETGPPVSNRDHDRYLYRVLQGLSWRRSTSRALSSAMSRSVE